MQGYRWVDPRTPIRVFSRTPSLPPPPELEPQPFLSPFRHVASPSSPSSFRKSAAPSLLASPNISWLQLVLNVGLSIRPSVRPSRRFVRGCRLHSSFVASARSYPSASLRNANAFCFSFTTLSTPEGERARDSFNNPAARSEIYYFRATLLDKSIWLTPPSPLPLLLHPSPPSSLVALVFFFGLPLPRPVVLPARELLYWVT